MFNAALLGLAFLVVCSGCRRGGGSGSVVTFGSSLSDLTNVAVFARSPLGKAGMVSSYDRTGGNQDWGKWEGPGKDGLLELVNLKGPGCVKRIWMTGGGERQWLFFFDGEKEPRLKVSMADLFGGKFPFVPPVSDLVSAGRYTYLPLPYRKSLRIAWDMEYKPGLRLYYHVNYETYPKGTDVTSYPGELNDAQRKHVEAVCGRWSDKATVARSVLAGLGEPDMLDVPPGATVAWLEREGPAELEAFAFRIEPAAGASAQQKVRLLRELVLRITWDAAASPSVEVPLGDFFCNAFHARRFEASSMAFVDGHYLCRFPMPFAKSARAELRNDGGVPVKIACRSSVRPLVDGEPVNYFHAGWRGSTARGIPLTVADARGRGHFVGCYLSAIGMDGTWTILEGDEAFRIDGEAVPSIHGTGLEDYFNGAWYYTALFDLPFHGLLEKASIRTDQYRFHLTDPVPFEKNLNVTFEFGDGNRARGYMSGVGYWYQDAPGTIGAALPALGQRFPPQDPYERVSIMGQLFELERIAFLEEARSRCLEYAGKFASQKPLAGVVRLRAAAYGEVLDGFESVRETYEAAAAGDPKLPATKQAADLLWFHEGTNSALLGIQANAKYKLYLDGKPVGEGQSPKTFDVYRVDLPPGPHELAVEGVATRPGSFVSVALRGQTTNVVSSLNWEYSRTKPASWPATDAEDAWEELGRGGGVLPTMYNMFFMPNAYVNMQSGRQKIGLWAGFKQQPRFPQVWLRKRFVVPVEGTGTTVTPLKGIERDADAQGVQNAR
jgi:hypothetical protein